MNLLDLKSLFFDSFTEDVQTTPVTRLRRRSSNHDQVKRQHPWPVIHLPFKAFKRRDTNQLAYLQYCPPEMFQSLMRAGASSRPHNQTNCHCFLASWQPYASWPKDELSLHYAASKVLDVAYDQIDRRFLRTLNGPLTAIDVARILVVERTEIIELIASEAQLQDSFANEVERTRFVEMCIEFYIVYELYSNLQKSEKDTAEM